jgi:hypothetical protein
MNYSAWAEWYDVIYSLAPAGEVDFYVQLAQDSASAHPAPRGDTPPDGHPVPVEGRPAVLELGVGTGRIVIPTVLAGANVTGIDLQPPMLDRARRNALRANVPVLGGKSNPRPNHSGTLDLIQADMRTLDLGRVFDLVTIPSNTLLLAASRTGQLETLKRAAAHTALGGRLTFDIFNPTSELLSSGSAEPFLWGETVNPVGGRRCRVWAINRFDTRRQLNRGTQIVEELDHRGRVARRVELDVLVRYVFPSEAHLLIERAGLRSLEMYGDFDCSPFAESSPRMVFICERRR